MASGKPDGCDWLKATIGVASGWRGEGLVPCFGVGLGEALRQMLGLRGEVEV